MQESDILPYDISLYIIHIMANIILESRDV